MSLSQILTHARAARLPRVNDFSRLCRRQLINVVPNPVNTDSSLRALSKGLLKFSEFRSPLIDVNFIKLLTYLLTPDVVSLIDLATWEQHHLTPV